MRHGSYPLHAPNSCNYVPFSLSPLRGEQIRNVSGLCFVFLLQIVRTLCLFLTPAERKCSRLCRTDSSFKYDTGLFVQGLLKVSTSLL